MAEISANQRMARNPLGIMALFISLIYGMNTLLVGTSLNQLSPHDKTILVWFNVAYPFAVLFIFSWLVAAHHNKLYGPSDFRNDESFLSAATLAPAASRATKRGAELTNIALRGAAVVERADSHALGDNLGK